MYDMNAFIVQEFGRFFSLQGQLVIAKGKYHFIIPQDLSLQVRICPPNPCTHTYMHAHI
jgi:hypothetical protein